MAAPLNDCLFLKIAILLLSIPCNLCLYEDQAGVFDWLVCLWCYFMYYNLYRFLPVHATYHDSGLNFHSHATRLNHAGLSRDVTTESVTPKIDICMF